MGNQRTASSEMFFPAEWSRVASERFSWYICTLCQVHWEYLKDLCLGWYFISLRKDWRNNSLLFWFLCKVCLRNYPSKVCNCLAVHQTFSFWTSVSDAKGPAGHKFVSVLGEMGASPSQRDADGTRATSEMVMRERCSSWELWLVGCETGRGW